MAIRNIVPARVRYSTLELEKARERWSAEKISRESRRLLRNTYKLRRAMKKLECSLKRVRTRKENQEVKQSVRILRAAKRMPGPRIRNRDEIGWRPMAPTAVFTKNSSGVVTKVTYVTNAQAKWGEKKSISDYHPIARLDPPRNLTTIKSVRVNSTSADVVLKFPAYEYYYQDIKLLNSKVALLGLGGVPASFYDISQTVGFDVPSANKALLKAQAKVYSADIQANEYLVEWKQVVNLLKDPLRTVLKFHRVLERWTRHDAWIYVPKSRKRHFDGGVLTLKTPTGGQLMSMRTKRELSLKEASSSLIAEASNRWLQYRYGIAPLVQDITSVMAMWVDGSFHKQPELLSKEARYTVEKIRNVSEYTTHDTVFTYIFKVVETKGEFYASKQWFKLLEDAPASYKLGLHPSQFLNVWWNATPWSFVADWVVNLDDWMTAQRSVPWINLHANYVTHKLYHKYVATLVKAVSISSGRAAVISGQPVAIAFKESMRREIDLPRVTELPVSEAWQSLKNALTGLSLLIQTTNTKRK